MQEPSPNAASGLPIRFVGVLVVVGGGTCDLALLRRLAEQGAAVIAADGGAANIVAAGLEPAAIIGDLDSLEDSEGWAKRTRLIRIDEQETTDFEKCLYATEAPVTIALGMTGERLDHTLAALDCMARHAAQRWIVLVDSIDLALAVSGAFGFEVAPGARVSVHPLAAVTFEGSKGLTYPLDRLTLAPGVRTGTSNAADDGPFEIVPAAGETAPWLLLIDKENLDALVERLLGR